MCDTIIQIDEAEWVAEDGGPLGGRWFPMAFAPGNNPKRLYDWPPETERAWDKYMRCRMGFSIGEYFERIGRELASIEPRPAIFIFFSRDFSCSGHVAQVRKAWFNAQIYHFAVHAKHGLRKKVAGVYHGTGGIHVASRYVLKKMAEESPLFHAIWQNLKELSPDDCGFYLARDPDASWLESIRPMEEALFAEYRDTRYMDNAGMKMVPPTAVESRLYEWADWFCRNKRPGEAALVMEEMLGKSSEHCNAWFRLYRYYLQAGQPERACDLLKRGMQKYPEAVVFDRLGADWCMQQGRWAAMERHLKKLWGANPWDRRVMLLWAQSSHYLGNFAMSAHLYGLCSEHRSLTFVDEGHYGVALSRAGRHEEALQVFRRMQRHPDCNPMIHNNVAMEMASVGKHEEAMAACETAMSEDPEDSAIWDTMGFIQYKLGLYEEAEYSLLTAIDFCPDYDYAWRHLLHVYHDWGQVDKLAKAKARVGYYMPEQLEQFEKEKGTDIVE